MALNSLHVWLDANIALNLSREAVEAVENALRVEAVAVDSDGREFGVRSPIIAELENAANIIRAHLQHLPPKGIPLHAEKDPLLT